jgi:hypothetical protein
MRYIFLFVLLAGCSSTPKVTGPDWIRQPTRIVDGGYIVYIGSATASNDSRAQFNAEGQALEDLANECSMIPKGARIEDRYAEKDKRDSKAWVKLALEFQECEEGKHAVDPNEIQRVANVPFTQQLKKYQDLMETGEMPTEVAAVDPGQIPPPPQRNPGWNDNTNFFVMRQYVAYQKEVVVLAPPTYYAANSPQNQQFTNTIRPTAEQITNVEHSTPAIRTQAWSQVPQRPLVARPASLSSRPQTMMGSRSVQPPQGMRRNQNPRAQQRPQQQRKPRKRKREK